MLAHVERRRLQERTEVRRHPADARRILLSLPAQLAPLQRLEDVAVAVEAPHVHENDPDRVDEDHDDRI